MHALYQYLLCLLKQKCSIAGNDNVLATENEIK